MIEKRSEEVVVPQTTIDAVNNQIVEGDKKVAQEVAKTVVESTTKSLDDLRKELEATREATRKIAEEQERVRIEAELAQEKARLEEAQKPRSRAVVPEVINPTVNPQPQPSQPLSVEQGWHEFETLSKNGQFKATVPFK
jgi:hypothetical protein